MDEFISKMLKQFGNEGIIIFSKSNDFFGNNQVTAEESMMLYDLIVGQMHPLANSKYARNLIGCTLYYQTLKNPLIGDTFYNYITRKLNMSNHLTNEKLYEIYNVIEFEYKFRRCQQNELKFLYNYLNKFAILPKTIEVFLLFKLYSAYLLYFLGDRNTALTESFEIVCYLHEEVKEEQETQFIRYIKLRNRLFNLKLNSDFSGSDPNELCSLSKEVYNEMKSVNKDISMKIGLIIFDTYLLKNDFVNCSKILEELSKIFKSEMIEGGGIENGIDFYLAFNSRKAACQTYLCNNQKLSSAIKKIDKALEFLSLSNMNSLIFLYKFLLLLYRYNNGINALPKEECSSIINNFKIQFLKNNTNAFYNDNITLSLNLAVMNPKNDESTFSASNFINDCIVKLENKEDLEYKNIIPFIIGVYNNISEQLFNFLSYRSSHLQEGVRNIQRYSKQIISYAMSNKHLASLLESPYFLMVFVKICFVQIAIHLCVNDLNSAQNKLEHFKNVVCPHLKIDPNNNTIPSFGLILKLEGDIFFKKKNYKNAIQSYEKAKNYFIKNDRRKACVLYNLGLSYCFTKNVRKGAEYFSLCLHVYNLMAREMNLSGLSRLNIGTFLEQKIDIVQDVISRINQVD